MDLSRAVDALLDLSVVGGYGRPGLALRRRLADWPADPPRMDGKVVAITGASAGIGRAAAVGFARLGASVHLVGRDQGRTEAAAAAVREQVPGAAVQVDLCDVSTLASLKAFTASWTGPLDVLVNNAGVMVAERELTDDGVERTFATNVLGPFWLVRELADRMTPGSRVITVSSGGMYGQRLDDDLLSEKYAAVAAYARTKRAEVVLTEMWAVRHPTIVFHAMHPGWADTPGIQGSLSTFAKVAGPILRSAEQGADTIVWLGGAPEAGEVSGLFWHDRRPRPTHLLGLNKEAAGARRALWELCEELASRG
ncbi:MAG: short-chain dehydrogenase/reductase [Frankiales bacterium]|nr:short-chain dehydrogenase/reductase [Frankiales bacterium]